MQIASDVIYVGVTDTGIDLFESQYKVHGGVTYNSYAIIDEKIAIMDSTDAHFTSEWLENVEKALSGKDADYLIVHHMEPDHSANISAFAKRYPDALIVASEKAFGMMKNFFGTDYPDRRIVVKDGDKLCLGRHTLTFISAPMVHWPEVMVSYDDESKLLFSADAFGRFGLIDDSDWIQEARRYYIGIVGKYGQQVSALLKKLAALNIKAICPLHGPVVTNVGEAVDLYSTWAQYRADGDGTVIAYASVYGNTKDAAQKLADLLEERSEQVHLFDLSRCDMHEAIALAFARPRLILAASTYNGGVFPPMKAFIDGLIERGYRNRRVGLIENGSWAPMAAKVMKNMLSECRDITFLENEVRILSRLNEESHEKLLALAGEIKI